MSQKDHQEILRRSPNRRRHIILGCLCLLLFGLQGAVFISSKSVTFDEAVHIGAGISAWHTGDFRIYPHNPPLVRMLATLPILALDVKMVFGEGWQKGLGIKLINEIAYAYKGRFHNLVMAGRMATLVMMVILGALLWYDARARYGKTAAMVAVVLFSFQPVCIAYGSLVTVDAGAALFFYLAVRTFIGYQKRGWRWDRAAVMGLALGAAVSAKFSNLTLFMILPALLLVIQGQGPSPSVSRGFVKILKPVLHMALALAVTLVIVNAVYGFQGSFGRLDSHHFTSRTVKRLTGFLPGSLRVPLPYQLVRGFDLQSYDNETKAGRNANTYWMGRWVKGRIPFFFPFLLATKLTFPLLLLAGACLGIKLYRGISGRGWDREWLGLMVPVLIHFIFMSWVVAMYLSFRYLIQIVPFLILLGSEAAQDLSSMLSRKWRPQTVIVALVLFFSLGTAALAFPHYLAYNNAFLGGQERQDRLDPDTGRHWGQGLIGLKKWMEQYPGETLYLGYFGSVDPLHYGIEWQVPPPRPAPGIWAVSRYWIIVDATQEFSFVRDQRLLMIDSPKPYFAWLKNQKPIHYIEHSIFIYRLPDTSLPSPALIEPD